MGRRFVAAGFGRIACIGTLAVGSLALANCAKVDFGGPKYSQRVVEDGQPIPKGNGVYRIGQPYQVRGRTYIPHENPNYRADGIASWYGRDFHGRLTANGEVYDMNSISAAHPTLPIPSYARVTNLSNGKSIVVRVNDRGPFVDNRVIDLSVKTAKILGTYSGGLSRVRVEYLGRAPLEGSDDRMLLATLRHGTPAPAPSSVMVAAAKPVVPDADSDDEPQHPVKRRARTRDADDDEPAPATQVAARSVRTTVVTASRTQAAPRFPSAPSYELAAAPPSPVRRSTNPVSAFAPVRDSGSMALMSGRGLY